MCVGPAAHKALPDGPLPCRWQIGLHLEECLMAASLKDGETMMQVLARTEYSRCKGRHVVAVLVGLNGELYLGTNGVEHPQPVCPRRAQSGYARGEDWGLCLSVCGQQGHAEAMAVQAAGQHAHGGTLLLFGHDTICPDCMALLEQAQVECCIIM